jgi:hypothetical protein
MNNLLFERLIEHKNHNVSIAIYGTECACLECLDCNQIIFDTDVYDLTETEE